MRSSLLARATAFAADTAALFVVVAALAQASFFVLQKPYLQRYGPLELTVWAIWVGTLPLLAFAPTAMSEVRAAGPEAILSAIWLGVFPGAIAYSTWAFALARSATARLTTVLYLVPVVTIVIAYVWLGEIPETASVLGGGVAIAGVVIVQGTPRNSNRRKGGPDGRQSQPGGEARLL